MALNKDFYKLFLFREGKELAGKRIKNILGLFAILLMTFLAIGFGEGGLDYLKIKMSDPFINWINIPIPFNRSEETSSFINSLENDTIKKRYNYNDIKSYAHFNQYFFEITGRQIQADGRTIETSSPLLRYILSNDNIIKGITSEDVDDYFGDQSIGLIVCKDFLNKLGYITNYPAFLYMVFPIPNEIDLRVPLPVICVVKQLPGMVSVMSTPLFYKETNYQTDQPFNISSFYHQKYLRYFIPENSGVDKWKRKIHDLLNKYQARIVNDPYVENYSKSFQKGSIIHFEIDTNSLKKGIHADILDQYIQKSFDPNNNQIIRIYDYQFGRFEKEEIGEDYLSVYFTSLDSIAQFQQFVQKKPLELKIEMSQINARENYNFVSKLTFITSLFLIIFSIISVSMFLSNLIKSHFERIKKNIGTFKAFGLDNKRLVITYSVISFIFVFCAASTAFLLADLLGSIGALKILLAGFGLNLEKGYLYFNLLTQKSLLTFLMIIALSTLIVYVRMTRMLKHTPGDLIYER
jgi:hypothetical protein